MIQHWLTLTFGYLGATTASIPCGTRTSRRPRRRGIRSRPALSIVEGLEDRVLLSVSSLESGLTSDFNSLTVDYSSYHSSRILVELQADAHLEDVAGLYEQTESLTQTVPGLWEVSLSDGASVEDALKAYRSSDAVLFAEPDYRIELMAPVTPNDSQFASLWGLSNTGQTGGTPDADIDAPEAWSITTGSAATIVAVIDTGVDYTHPDLAANMWVNSGEIAGNGLDDDADGFIDDVYGYDFVNDDGDPMDDHGHGTHVSGTIGAVGNNDTGVTGVNWSVRIMALKFLDADGSGYTSDAVRALDYAVAHGAKISNNSWGGGGFSQTMLDAITRARDAGHIFVTAAGNDGANNDTSPHYPSNYNLDNVISVAAADHNDQLASFSNYGSATVDLAAPGVGILSTTPGNTYSIFSGTSMATPHVAGVVALVQSQHPNWTYTQIVDQVLGTVDPIPALAGKTVTGGRLNAAAAVGAPGADVVGPHVVSTSPSGSVANPVNGVRLTFSESINPATFTTADVTSFTGPNGAITVSSVNPVSGSNDRQFDVAFASQSSLGDYSLTLGPLVADPSGNLMDQDRDGFAGETPDDQYTLTFTITDQQVFSSADVPVAIHDKSTIRSTLSVNDDVRIADLNVQLNLTHTWDADLEMTLVSPVGRRVVLSQYRGGSGDDYQNTIFDDEADVSIASGSAPFVGSFRPEESLAAFDGISVRGTWTLEVYDRATWDEGTLNTWSLVVEPGEDSTLTFEAERDFYHQLGRQAGDAWSASTAQDSSGYFNYGPYTTQFSAGAYTAVFRLLVDNNSFDNSEIVTVDVSDAQTGRILASRLIRRRDFDAPWTYQDFALNFTAETGQRLEFRTYWYDRSYVRQDWVRVNNRPAPQAVVFEAESDFRHQIGRLDADGWSANTMQDRSGFLNYGPYTTDVAAGTNSAVFRLLVDNNSYDNSEVVTLDVTDARTGQSLARRVVRRREFSSPFAYQNFALDFTAQAGQMLEFRTFWHGTSYVRQDSVRVEMSQSNSGQSLGVRAAADGPSLERAVLFQVNELQTVLSDFHTQRADFPQEPGEIEMSDSAVWLSGEPNPVRGRIIPAFTQALTENEPSPDPAQAQDVSPTRNDTRRDDRGGSDLRARTSSQPDVQLSSAEDLDRVFTNAGDDVMAELLLGTRELLNGVGRTL